MRLSQTAVIHIVCIITNKVFATVAVKFLLIWLSFLKEIETCEVPVTLKIQGCHSSFSKESNLLGCYGRATGK